MKKTKKVKDKTETSVRSHHFFLTIPTFKLPPEKIIEKIKEKELESYPNLKYFIVQETHTLEEKGCHIHLYIDFKNKRQIPFTYFDYLGKHGHLQSAGNEIAIVNYLTKENKPIANFDYNPLILSYDFPKAMLHIREHQGLNEREIYLKYPGVVAKKNWSSFLKLLKYNEGSKHFINEINKPGLRRITGKLIRQRLTKKEYAKYKSDKELYDLIIGKINEMIHYKYNRPPRTKMLFLLGKPGTGKTSFVDFLTQRVSTYNFPYQLYFPDYENYVFKVIHWSEFTIKDYADEIILKFIGGEVVILPVKLSELKKLDNPLIIATANFSLEAILSICRSNLKHDNYQLWKTRLESYRQRILEVNIGTKDIFFLQQLIVAKTEDVSVRHILDPDLKKEGIKKLISVQDYNLRLAKNK